MCELWGFLFYRFEIIFSLIFENRRSFILIICIIANIQLDFPNYKLNFCL